MEPKICVAFFFILYFSKCSGVIYRVNESEYQRMPSLFVLDEYEGCLEEKDGVYCLLQLQLQAEDDNPLMRFIQEYSAYDTKHYDHSKIDRGVCVRKTCGKYVDMLNETEGLERSLEACFNESIWKTYSLEAKMNRLLYCDHHNESINITTLDWVVLSVALALLTLIFVASSYDYVMNKQSEKNKTYGNIYFLSFSLRQNWIFLTNMDTSDPKIKDLQSFHALKTAACIMIMMAHSLWVITMGFTANSHDVEKTYDYPLYLFLYSGVMIVQIFFFLSGYLLIHNLKYIEQTRRLTAWDIPKVILFRIMRLLPALSATVLFAMTWVRYVGSGPLWNRYVTSPLVDNCRNYGWQSLLFINNYFPNNNHWCILTNWYMSVEFQVFVVGLVAYVLTRGQRRWWALGTLLLVGTVSPAVHVLLQDLDVMVMLKPEVFRSMDDRTYRLMHIQGHNNLPCYIMGMFTASFVHVWNRKRRDLSKNKWSGVVPYVALGLGLVLVSSGSLFYSERGGRAVRAVYGAAVRPALGALAAAGVAVLVLKAPFPLRSAVEWRGWAVPGRLSYCMYLIHSFPLYILLGLRPQLSSVTYFYMAITHLGVVAFSFLLSIPMYLTVEAPFSRLVKNLRS